MSTILIGFFEKIFIIFLKSFFGGFRQNIFVFVMSFQNTFLMKCYYIFEFFWGGLWILNIKTLIIA